MSFKLEKKKIALRYLASQFKNVKVEELEVFFALQETVDRVRAKSETFLNKMKLNRARFMPLALLFSSENKRLTPSELAEQVCVTRATMTGLLDSLEKDGYIRRVNEPSDRRSVMIELTSAGEKLARKVLPNHFAWLGDVMAGLTESERRTMNTVFKKMSANLDEAERNET